MTSLTSRGTSWIFSIPCANHDSGVFKLIFTKQMIKGEAMIPYKVCPNCQRAYPVIAFIKHSILKKDGYVFLEGDRFCHLCDPPDTIFINVDHNNRTRMRVKLRWENNQPVKFWDKKDHCWRALETIGIHRMTKTGNEFRFQPYKNRRTSMTGEEYNSN